MSAYTDSTFTWPARPEVTDGVTCYQRGYGYELPKILGEWEYSATFNRWGRMVTFSDDSQPVYTWPEVC